MSDESKEFDFSAVLASSVHDMKNSITMFLGTLDDIALKCAPENCASHEKLILLQHEGQRLNRHLIQLLTLYKIGNSQYFLNIDEHFIDELFEDVALENEMLLNARGINLEIQCEDGLSGYFDRELICGVINTIVNNAYRYARKTVRLVGCQRDGYLTLSVEDDGPGYPATMLQENSSQNTSINFASGGTGLGLYFAGKVAALHKADERHGYTETSNKGINNGGCFEIHLP
jgi:signal transduction histidine kinase